jgi:hypothetical protein
MYILVVEILNREMIAMNVYRVIALSILLASLAGIAYCQSEMNETTGANETTGIAPSVTIMDQTAAGNNMIANVTVTEAVSDGPGWVVIHNNLFGHPGGVVGYTHVDSGISSNVSVTIHSFVATDSLFAVLHYDRGEAGVFEYPAIDTEQMADRQIVIKPFSVSTNWNAMLMNLTQMAEDARTE